MAATYNLRKAFHLAGAHDYFYVPVALFAERSTYPGESDSFEGVGVKFAEILIIDESGAQWLDDDLPHLRRWSRFNEDSK